LEHLKQLEESVQVKVDAVLQELVTKEDEQLEAADQQRAVNVVDALNGLGDLIT
jgi:hypothetical protein